MTRVDHAPLQWPPVHLAHTEDFEIGRLQVRPSRREVEAEGRQHVLQPRTMQVLVALARSSSVVVSHEELNVRCWGGLTVGEDAIGRCIGQLRRLARQWTPPVFEIVTTVGVGYRIETPAPSLPNAPSVSRPHAKRGHVRSALIVAVFAAVAAGVWHWRKPASPPMTGVAVTAFRAQGGAAAQGLGRAIDAELLSQLNASQIPARAMTASEAEHDHGPANGLQVRGVVTDEGAGVQATVQLIDGRTGNVIWTERFKRGLEDSKAMPAAVAAQSADMVEIARLALSASPPLSDAALTSLLAAQSAIRWDRSDGWARRIQLAHDLTRQAPLFALGRSMLAATDINAVRLGVFPEQSRALSQEAHREAGLAIKLDPADAGGYYALALLEPKLAAREAIIAKGLAYNGHPRAQLGGLEGLQGHLLLSVGRVREALPHVDRALALDRLSPLRASNAIVTYALAGKLDEARDLLHSALERWPDQPDVLSAQLYLVTFFDRPAPARDLPVAYDRVSSKLGGEAASLWREYMSARTSFSPAKRTAAAERIFRSADQGLFNPRFAILMLAQLGDLDHAFEGLAGLRNNTSDVTGFEFGPAAAPLRADPRFLAYARRAGLMAYWRHTGRLSDVCQGPSPETECAALRAELTDARSGAVTPGR